MASKIDMRNAGLLPTNKGETTTENTSSQVSPHTFGETAAEYFSDLGQGKFEALGRLYKERPAETSVITGLGITALYGTYKLVDMAFGGRKKGSPAAPAPAPVQALSSPPVSNEGWFESMLRGKLGRWFQIGAGTAFAGVVLGKITGFWDKFTANPLDIFKNWATRQAEQVVGAATEQAESFYDKSGLRIIKEELWSWLDKNHQGWRENPIFKWVLELGDPSNVIDTLGLDKDHLMDNLPSLLAKGGVFGLLCSFMGAKKAVANFALYEFFAHGQDKNSGTGQVVDYIIRTIDLKAEDVKLRINEILGHFGLDLEVIGLGDILTDIPKSLDRLFELTSEHPVLAVAAVDSAWYMRHLVIFITKYLLKFLAAGSWKTIKFIKDNLTASGVLMALGGVAYVERRKVVADISKLLYKREEEQKEFTAYTIDLLGIEGDPVHEKLLDPFYERLLKDPLEFLRNPQFKMEFFKKITKGEVYIKLGGPPGMALGIVQQTSILWHALNLEAGIVESLMEELGDYDHDGSISRCVAVGLTEEAVVFGLITTSLVSGMLNGYIILMDEAVGMTCFQKTWKILKSFIFIGTSGGRIGLSPEWKTVVSAMTREVGQTLTFGTFKRHSEVAIIKRCFNIAEEILKTHKGSHLETLKKVIQGIRGVNLELYNDIYKIQELCADVMADTNAGKGVEKAKIILEQIKTQVLGKYTGAGTPDPELVKTNLLYEKYLKWTNKMKEEGRLTGRVLTKSEIFSGETFSFLSKAEGPLLAIILIHNVANSQDPKSTIVGMGADLVGFHLAFKVFGAAYRVTPGHPLVKGLAALGISVGVYFTGEELTKLVLEKVPDKYYIIAQGIAQGCDIISLGSITSILWNYLDHPGGSVPAIISSAKDERSYLTKTYTGITFSDDNGDWTWPKLTSFTLNNVEDWNRNIKEAMSHEIDPLKKRLLQNQIINDDWIKAQAMLITQIKLIQFTSGTQIVEKFQANNSLSEKELFAVKYMFDKSELMTAYSLKVSPEKFFELRSISAWDICEGKADPEMWKNYKMLSKYIVDSEEFFKHIGYDGLIHSQVRRFEQSPEALREGLQKSMAEKYGIDPSFFAGVS